MIYWKAFLPCLLTFFLIFPPRDSIRAYVHTFAHAFVRRGKRCNFTCLFQWTGIWEVVIWWKYLRSCVFMLEFLLPQVCSDAYYSSMLCNLFLYVETIRIVLYLVPVSLRSINFRRRVMGEVSMCSLIRSRPCSVSPNTCYAVNFGLPDCCFNRQACPFAATWLSPIAV